MFNKPRKGFKLMILIYFGLIILSLFLKKYYRGLPWLVSIGGIFIILISLMILPKIEENKHKVKEKDFLWSDNFKKKLSEEYFKISRIWRILDIILIMGVFIFWTFIFSKEGFGPKKIYIFIIMIVVSVLAVISLFNIIGSFIFTMGYPELKIYNDGIKGRNINARWENLIVSLPINDFDLREFIFYPTFEIYYEAKRREKSLRSANYFVKFEITYKDILSDNIKEKKSFIIPINDKKGFLNQMKSLGKI